MQAAANITGQTLEYLKLSSLEYPPSQSMKPRLAKNTPKTKSPTKK